MKRKRYTGEQSSATLKERKAGATVPELVRRHGVAENTSYHRKWKFEGREVWEANRFRDLEQENTRLNHLLAEAEPDKEALKELVEGKW